jgi:hypothetical protein
MMSSDQYFEAGYKAFQAEPGVAGLVPITQETIALLVYHMARAAVRAEWAASRIGLYPPILVKDA